MRSPIRWLALLLSLVGAQELIASSQFNMVLGPISDRLAVKDLQVIENSIGAVLLSLLTDENEYLNIEAVIQESDFLESSQPSSQIRFFVLATTQTQSEKQRDELNGLVKDSIFGTELGKEAFLEKVRESNRTSLVAVSHVKVVPLAPSSSDPSSDENPGSSSSSRRLSSLDLILISVSALIFVGICYMIVQHHKDRGYFENQRVLAANQPIRTSQNNEESSAPRSIHIHHKDTDVVADQNTPSTPSTIHSTEFRNTSHPSQLQLHFSDDDSQQHVKVMTPKVLLSALSGENTSVNDTGTGEGLENVWFGPANASTNNKEGTAAVAKVSDAANSDNARIGDLRDTLSLSDESDDVFFVDVENASNSFDDRGAHSSRGEIQAWMKTIQVVSSSTSPINSSDTKTSDMTQSSHDASLASGPSLALASLDATEIEHRSLEQSMASSKAGTGVQRVRISTRAEV